MTQSLDELDIPHWCVLESADRLGEDIQEKSIVATDEDLELVRNRLDLESVRSIKADYKFERVNGYIVHVQGRVKAEIVQNCVVTLEPIESSIDEPIEAWFADPEEIVGFDKARKQKELENEDGEIPVLDEKDDPEPIVDGQIDLGDLAVQFLSLAIDPYPHKEGAVHDLTDEDEEALKETRMQDNPFAKLKDWKAGNKD